MLFKYSIVDGLEINVCLSSYIQKEEKYITKQHRDENHLILQYYF